MNSQKHRPFFIYGVFMNELKIFSNDQFGEIRTIIVNSELWFVAKDICDKLELTNNSEVLKRIDLEDLSQTEVFDPNGKQRLTNIVNESGLYAIIFQSNKPEAKIFKKWITSEVIPSIRKTGTYMTENAIEKILNDPDAFINILQSYKTEKKLRIESEQKNAILMHVSKLYTSTEIAKELNMKSAISLNNLLHDLGIQYKSNDTWVLYSNYANLGYEEIKQEVLDNGKVIYHRKWTQEGRNFIINMVKNPIK
jgi:prophage antirepressor-like protein